MKYCFGVLFVSLIALLPSSLSAQREFCVGEPACIDDTLEVIIQTDGPTSVLELDEFTAGKEIEADLTTETASAEIQGWSYALKHDEAVMTITLATTAGTKGSGSPSLSAATRSVASTGCLPARQRYMVAPMAYKSVHGPCLVREWYCSKGA